MPQLIVFAGLPGTGKTTLATRLAAQLENSVLINKDDIRSSLFADRHVEYSARQNDFCMEVAYHLAEYHLQNYPVRTVIIDGRTYSQAAQVATLQQKVAQWHCQLMVIECRCSRETMLQRINQDIGKHQASDRTVGNVEAMLDKAVPLQLLRCIIETDKESISEQLLRIHQYLRVQNETRPVV